ncbi:MAG TPA: DUF2058 domain-containing protein [Xylella taiwanensis]
MSDSFRDQLVGLGFKPFPKPESKSSPGGKRRPVHAKSGKSGSVHGARSQPSSSDRPSSGERTKGRLLRSQEDIDLAKAYAIRAQREKAEQMEIERLKQEAARQRWEAKTRFEALVKDKALNHPEADIARYFSYGGKIKRIYVTADQLKALNAGELGVVQLKGRYLLVTAELLAEIEVVFAPAIALKIDPNLPEQADSYADPKYRVPDDLVW